MSEDTQTTSPTISTTAMLLNIASICCIIASECVQWARGDEVAEKGYSRFHSRPDLRVPHLNITVNEPGIYDEPILLAPFFLERSRPDSGLYIYDARGGLIWSGQSVSAGGGASDVHNLHVCRYLGEDHLCYWQGAQRGMHGVGMGVILNREYNVVKVVHSIRPTQAIDLHEFKLTDDGTALVTIYEELLHDGYWIMDTIFQEINLVDGTLLFEWRALDHLSPNASHTPINAFHLLGSGRSSGSSWDWIHLNSIDKTTEGNYLVSARHFDSIMLISGLNGSVLWYLDGTGSPSSFESKDIHFQRQHHALIISESEGQMVISIFNNDNDGFLVNHDSSSGILVELDLHNMIATKLANYDARSTTGMGAMHLLSNGNVFIASGADAELSEYRSSGELVFRAELSSQAWNYRAVKHAWSGFPSQPPALWTYALSDSEPLAMHVSWNGATDVSKWRFLVSRTKSGPFQVIGEITKQEFETTHVTVSFWEWAYVEALDINQQVIGQSLVVNTYIPPSLEGCHTTHCDAAQYEEPVELKGWHQPSKVVSVLTPSATPSLSRCNTDVNLIQSSPTIALTFIIFTLSSCAVMSSIAALLWQHRRRHFDYPVMDLDFIQL